MKRLMEKMVFSGLVIAWRLATWPTRRSPDLAKATTDGVIRPPSELVMTCGSPASMAATTELVVPRSMPMILPIGSVLLRIRYVRVRWVVRDAHQGGSQHSVAEPIPALHLVDHDVVGVLARLLVHDGLVQIGIEWLASRLDRGHPLALQHGAQLALHELDALDPAFVGILRDAGQRAVEVIENGEQLGDEHGVRDL